MAGITENPVVNIAEEVKQKYGEILAYWRWLGVVAFLLAVASIVFMVAGLWHVAEVLVIVSTILAGIAYIAKGLQKLGEIGVTIASMIAEIDVRNAEQFCAIGSKLQPAKTKDDTQG